MTDRQPAPRIADERATLVGFLDYYRATLVSKVDGLTDEQARIASVPPSDLNLLGLLRHMADVERYWFRAQFAGTEAPPLYYGDSHPSRDPDGDLHPGPDDTVADALVSWQREVDFARELTATTDLGALSARPAGARGHNSLRWVLVHLIEEYARHCGHADLIRERIDGATGD